MAIPRLYPVNAFIGSVAKVKGDYVYYTYSATQMRRVLSAEPSGTPETVVSDIRALDGAEVDEYTHNLFVSDSGLVFIMTYGLSSGGYKVFVSDDGFSTLKTDVLLSGYDGSTHLDIRRMLGQHSMCDATLEDGSQVVLFAEYNVGTSSNPPYNTYIHKYDIATATWSQYWEGRGATSAARFHMHTIYQDPYTMDIIVCCGDAGNDAAIIIGKPTTDWSSIDAVTPDEIESTDSTFNVLYGSQEYRCIDLLITEDYYYSHTDASGNDEIGIYQFPKDLSSYTKVYNPDSLESATGNVVGGAGFVTQSGKLLFMDFLNGKGAAIPEKSNGNTIRLHLSEDGVNWTTVAKWLLEDSRTTARWGSGIGQDNDGKIWIGGSCSSDTCGISGLNHSTCVIESGEWNESYGQEVLSPVIWVSTGGNDANTGYTSDAPLLTLKAALASANVTYGARIMLGAGNHYTDAAVLDYQGNTAEGDIENPVIIEGVRGQTTLYIDRDNTGYGVQGNSGDGDVVFKDIRIISDYGSPLFSDAGDYDGTVTDQTVEGKINWR